MLSAFLKFIFNLLAVSSLLTFIYFQFITVPAGYLGFLKSRSDGWQQQALQAGWHWRPLAFLPDQYEVFLVEKNPPPLDVNFKKGLQYTDYLGLSDVFRLQLKLRLHYTISEEAAFYLLTQIDDDVNSWPMIIKSRLESQLDKKFNEFYTSNRAINNLEANYDEYFRADGAFASDWQTIFSEEKLNLTRWRLLKNYAPDAALYLAQTQNINQVFTARRQAVIARIAAQSKAYEKNVLNKTELDKAENFSKLIKQNKDLLKYYSIEKMNPRAKVIISGGGNRLLKPQGSVEETTEEESSSGETGSVAPISR